MELLNWFKYKTNHFRIAATACGPITNRSRDVESLALGLNKEEFVEKKSDISASFDKIISPHAMPEFRREATRRMIEYFIEESAKGRSKRFYN